MLRVCVCVCVGTPPSDSCDHEKTVQNRRLFPAQSDRWSECVSLRLTACGLGTRGQMAPGMRERAPRVRTAVLSPAFWGSEAGEDWKNLPAPHAPAVLQSCGLSRGCMWTWPQVIYTGTGPVSLNKLFRMKLIAALSPLVLTELFFYFRAIYLVEKFSLLWMLSVCIKL